MSIESLMTWSDGVERETFGGVPREELHLHERWELVAPVRRPIVVQHREAHIWVPTEGAVLIGPGVVHRLLPAGSEPGAVERFYLPPSIAQSALAAGWLEAARANPQVIPAPQDGDWIGVVRGPLCNSETRPLEPTRPAARPAHPGLARAVRYLEDNLQRTVSLDELSQAVELSKFHLCRMFHRIVGVTPRTYHRHIRLERGRRFLLEGRSASEIARSLRFSDQSHFIRSFRKQFGATPGELSAKRLEWCRRKRAPGQHVCA